MHDSDLDTRDPAWIDAWVKTWGAWLTAWFRSHVAGMERLPPGRALLVGNHSGGKSIGDGVFATEFVRTYGANEPLFILVHRAFSHVPPVRRSLARLGLVTASRQHAEAGLQRGAKVMVYPGADHDAFRPFTARDRVNLGGRCGFIRVAARAGVPIVPVVTAGSHETFVVLAQGKKLARALAMPKIFGLHSFPATLSLPYGLLVGPACLLPHLPLPARIEVEVGSPIEVPAHLAHVPRDDPELAAMYTEIERTMDETLRGLYADRRWPVLG